MANIRVCDHCGAVEDLHVTPPNVEPLQIRDAVANYDSICCQTCKLTKSLRELMDKSETTPGGTVDGADKIMYLVH